MLNFAKTNAISSFGYKNFLISIQNIDLIIYYALTFLLQYKYFFGTHLYHEIIEFVVTFFDNMKIGCLFFLEIFLFYKNAK
jgi:hypothetical protein